MRKVKENEANFLILSNKDQILIERAKTYLLAVINGTNLTVQEALIAKKGLNIARKILKEGKTWKKTFVNYDIDDFMKICETINVRQITNSPII